MALALADASVSVFIRAQGFQRPTKLILGLPTHFDFPRRFCYNEATNGSLCNARKDGIVTEIATKKARVLCIEDQAGMLDLLRLILESADYTFLGARDGVEGLEMMCDEQPDLILLDVRMPRMNGYEACAVLRSRESTRDIPIVFLSARGQETEIRRGLEMGAEEYILKPFAPDDLYQRVGNILDRLERG